MSRLTKEEQIEYDIKIKSLINNYKKLRTEKDTINSVQLIESHNIYRNNKLINYKQLSNILLKHKILSQMKWRQKIVQKMYIFLDNNNISREEIVKKIAQRLDLKIEHINALLRTQGLGIISHPENDIIKDYESGLVAKELFRKYKITCKIFNTIAKKNNIEVDNFYYVKNSIYNYRDLFTINTINSHLLGLIWADGSISSGKAVVISLQIDDKQYLESIQKYLFIDNNITKLTISDRSKEVNRHSYKDTVSLSITRLEYFHFLEKQGLPINKEKNEIKLPSSMYKAKDKYFLAFLRGFFEGDGTLVHSATPSLGFSVSKECGLDLQNQLLNRFSIKSSMVKDKSIFRLSIGGVSPVFFILLNMYRIEPKILMERKFITAKRVWLKFLPDYLKVLIPEFKFKYILNDSIVDKANELLQHMFNQGEEIVYLENKALNIKFEGTKKHFTEKYNVKTQMINRVLSGERHATSNWTLINDLKTQDIHNKSKFILSRNSDSMKEIIYMIHKVQNKTFMGKKIDFIEKYNIKLDYINRVLSGERNSVDNWKIDFSKYNQQYIEDKYLKSLKDKSHLYQDIIHMKKKNINEEFIGKKIDFLLKFKIKVPYLNRVLQGERNTVLDWYMIVE